MHRKYSRGPRLQHIDVNRKTSVAFTQQLSDQKTCIQRVGHACESQFDRIMKEECYTEGWQ